jgi:hypothetical protein
MNASSFPLGTTLDFIVLMMTRFNDEKFEKNTFMIIRPQF